MYLHSTLLFSQNTSRATWMGAGHLNESEEDKRPWLKDISRSETLINIMSRHATLDCLSIVFKDFRACTRQQELIKSPVLDLASDDPRFGLHISSHSALLDNDAANVHTSAIVQTHETRHSAELSQPALSATG